MSVNFPYGFQITSQDPIDERLILSKEQMLKMPAARMPQTYFCLCQEDNCFYLYNKNHPFSETTGYFKKLGIEQLLQTTEELENAGNAFTNIVLYGGSADEVFLNDK